MGGKLNMKDDTTFTDIDPAGLTSTPTAAQISSGIPIPPIRLIQIFSPEEWEEFTEECLAYYKSYRTYQAIRRYSGPGDLGLDAVAFTTDNGFAEPWDSFQCKHYDHPLLPEDVSIEVAKLIYHSFAQTPPFNQTCRVPRKHLFVSPCGSGITVGRWFKDPGRFKKEIGERWREKGLPNIGKGIGATFDGAFESYFDGFDFSIFGDVSAAELIELHSKTQFHAARFGGGLPAREAVPAPPSEPAPKESLYLRKLLDAYGDYLEQTVADKEQLAPHTELQEHYDRQRVLFYSAEALRNFARDRTPSGTFDSLKEDIFHGVIDVCDATYESGLARVRSTVTAAGTMDISGNALAGVTRVPDKQGVCHHLANDDRLTWVKDED